MEKKLEEYKDFVYSKLNTGREDNNFLWLPMSRHIFDNEHLVDARIEIARTRLSLQGLIGVVDELNELYKICEENGSKKDILLEAGDVFFYLALLEVTSIFDETSIFNVTDNEIYNNACVPESIRSEALEIGKKIIFQERKDLLPALQKCLRNITVDTIRRILSAYEGMDRKVAIIFIIEKNMEKLNKRYKNGFSVEQSKNRD